MSTKTMQITITKKDLDDVAARATLAAVSEEGRNEMQKANNETRGCVRIAAKGNQIVFESSVSRFSVKHVIPVGGDVEIISEGETCVPAADLKMVANKIRKDRKVSINFIAVEPDASLAMSPVAKAILPDGVVEVGSLNGDRIVAKTKIEAYPTAGFAAPQYPSDGELSVVMSGKASTIRDAVNTIGFCVNPKDQKEIYDKFAIFPSPDAIYFLGSDGRRCAVSKVPVSSFDKTIGTEFKAPLLVDAILFSPVVSTLSADEPVVVGTDAEGQRFFIVAGKTTYCINMVTESLRMKYPNYRRLIDLPVGVVVTVNREELAEAIGMLDVVNHDRGRHTFCRDLEVVRLLGRGVGSIKEATGQVPCKVVGEMKGEQISLQTGYLVDGIKKMAAENIKMSFTVDEKRVNVEDENNPKFSYYLQVMNPNDI